MSLGNVSPKARAIEFHAEKAPEFERLYKAFEDDPYKSAFTYGRKKIEEFIDEIVDGLPKETRALDIGCGTGFNLARLSGKGFEVVGLEPAEEMRQRARINNPEIEILDGDIENLPVPSSSFDLVLCIEVIRYLVDPQPALAELSRVLRPGGVAIVTAAPLWSLNGYALVNQVTSRVRLPTFTKLPQSFMSQRKASRIMQESGFRSVEVHGLFLGPWIIVDRVSPKALAAALRRWEPIDERFADRPSLRNLTNHLVLVGRR